MHLSHPNAGFMQSIEKTDGDTDAQMSAYDLQMHQTALVTRRCAQALSAEVSEHGARSTVRCAVCTVEEGGRDNVVSMLGVSLSYVYMLCSSHPIPS